MAKINIKKIVCSIWLILFSSYQIADAQDITSSVVTPAAVATPSPAMSAPPLSSPPSAMSAPPLSSPPSAMSAPPPSSPPPNVMQFQDWLKNNGQENPPPAPLSNPSSAVNIIQTVPIHHPRVKRVTVRTRSKPLTYEQEQKIMLDSAPPSSFPPDPDSDIAFNTMMKQNLPLTPQQVVKLKQMIDQSQRAAVIPPTVPPKPVSSTLMVNLAPGATPPAIRLSKGYVSSLVFVDSSGAPWPIASYDIGDPKTTAIQWDGKSNVLIVQAMAAYGDSDLVIRLLGMPTPITLELVLGQRVVDYRTDIHVAGFGPNSKDLPTGTGLPNSANQLLLNVLEGVGPPNSKLLSVMGGDCSAWLLDDRMYLRTRLTLLSPGWTGRVVSPDGMMAYEIQKSSSVLVSQYGEPIELKIAGF